MFDSPLRQFADKKIHEIELFRTQEETPKGKAEEDQDPYKIRPRGELRKLKQLAQLAGGKQE